MNFPLIISLIFIAAGLLGVIVPALPDSILVFLGVLIYAIWTKFEFVSLNLTIVLGALAVFILVVDYLGSLFGAKKFGASKKGLVGAVLGAIFGFIFFNFIGLIIGGILTAAAFEIIFNQKDFKQALKIGFGAFLGLFLGTFLKIILLVLMVGLFLKAVF